MNTLGIDPKTLSLRHVVCGGEPWTEEMRREIEERLFVTATDNYGVNEVMGPGVAGECLEKAGMHVQEDHFVVEVIDPQTGEVLPPGSLGELVITTLTKEAFPVVRYRTGDLCRIIDKPCACGRTTVRISRIEGRSDDVVVIKGINIVPQRIGEVLERIKGSRPPYQLVAVREGHEDHLEIRIGVTEEFFFDKMRDQKTLVDEMRQKVANFIGITPRIKLVELPSLKRDAHGKIMLFVDERSQ
jgi:phenylacetate-CoA ligase